MRSTSNAPTANANLHVFVGIKMSRQHLRDQLGSPARLLPSHPLLSLAAVMDSRSHWSRQTAADFLPSSTLLAGNEHLISAAGTNQMEPINKTHETNTRSQGKEKAPWSKRAAYSVIVFPFRLPQAMGSRWSGTVAREWSAKDINLCSTIIKCFFQKVLKGVSHRFY